MTPDELTNWATSAPEVDGVEILTTTRASPDPEVADMKDRGCRWSIAGDGRDGFANPVDVGMPVSGDDYVRLSYGERGVG
ncbi:hypothetical protein [Cryobacterium sp. SO1]|uniref:hypothetical protein n=1 Tax=Cryobacterium sp. SO1 TaxID=1897061 RepID=UPI0010230A2E|nr:hypothetical protein [Cryobacterium sp. SO1]